MYESSSYSARLRDTGTLYLFLSLSLLMPRRKEKRALARLFVRPLFLSARTHALSFTFTTSLTLSPGPLVVFSCQRHRPNDRTTTQYTTIEVQRVRARGDRHVRQHATVSSVSIIGNLRRRVRMQTVIFIEFKSRFYGRKRATDDRQKDTLASEQKVHVSGLVRAGRNRSWK